MLAVFALPARAQPPHDRGNQVQDRESGAPHEMGQAAFAAIQEVVTLLRADPATAWETVNIDALRQHLIDMDNVILHAAVSTTVRDGAVAFDVSGQGAVRDSIQRMVLAQAATSHEAAGGIYGATLTDRGAILTVSTGDPATALRLKALGYFGLVSQGPHHQIHHMMIARGEALP
ncbi:MAG: hypothetical protein ABMA14_28895 [Hyphomonadaceae bacterium]